MLARLLRSDALDALIELVRSTFDCAVATISVMGERQWFLSSAGHDALSGDRNVAICMRTIERDELMVIPNLEIDAEFRTHPMVDIEGGIRFYAGLPLRIEPDFFSMPVRAAFCIVDVVPRTFTDEEQARLKQFAAIASSMVESSVRFAGSHGRVEMQANLVERLVRKQVQFRQAETMAQMGHWRLDLETKLVEWSEGVFEIHDLPVRDRPQVEQALSYYEPESRARLKRLIERAIEDGVPYEAELDLRTSRSLYKRVRTRGEPEIQDGKTVALIGVFYDVTERYELERRLRRAAQTDPLTGLGNRAAMRAFVDNRKADESLSVMLLDLDGFKQVNDLLGHLTGDDVIRQMAGQLRAMIPAPHFVGRFGGDEFIVILMGNALTQPLGKLAERVADGMVHQIERDTTKLQVSASIGVHTLAQGESLEEALAKADSALYKAKRSTRQAA